MLDSVSFVNSIVPEFRPRFTRMNISNLFVPLCDLCHLRGLEGESPFRSFLIFLSLLSVPAISAISAVNLFLPPRAEPPRARFLESGAAGASRIPAMTDFRAEALSWAWRA